MLCLKTKMNNQPHMFKKKKIELSMKPITNKYRHIRLIKENLMRNKEYINQRGFSGNRTIQEINMKNMKNFVDYKNNKSKHKDY